MTLNVDDAVKLRVWNEARGGAPFMLVGVIKAVPNSLVDNTIGRKTIGLYCVIGMLATIGENCAFGKVNCKK